MHHPRQPHQLVTNDGRISPARLQHLRDMRAAQRLANGPALKPLVGPRRAKP